MSPRWGLIGDVPIAIGQATPGRSRLFGQATPGRSRLFGQATPGRSRLFGQARLLEQALAFGQG
jgi:hypothetical protein